MAKPKPNPAVQARIAQSLQQAVALHQQGRLFEAEALYESVLKAAPKDFNALHLLGVLRHQQGRSVEALDLIAAALRSRSGSIDALCNHGVVLDSLGRHAEAVVSYDQALKLKPDQIKPLCTRAEALLKVGRLEDALAGYERVLALQPDHVDALVGRGSALFRLARHEDALASFERAIALQPHHLDALNNRGSALELLERHDEALASFDAALAVAPRHGPALANRGHVLLTLGRPREALASVEAALAVDPNHVEALLVHASVLDALDRFDEAEHSYDRALVFRPDSADASAHKGLICLNQGRFAEGWPLYERRFQCGTQAREYATPHWNGQPFPGRLLLWGEQGLGDMILHASMVPELVGRAGSLVLEVDSRLVELFARSFAGVEAVPLAPELYAGPIDAHLPLGSLGGYLRPGWEMFPRREHGYLVADRARAASLRQRLAGDGRIVVGLSWRSVAALIGALKSARLTDFAPLLRQPRYRFIDLQYGDTLADRDQVERELGIRVERLEDIDNHNDIDGLAALMMACDAVVTTSNVTAHLAGALGRPTYVFVSFGRSRIWYWFRDRDDSPWYPNVRLIRRAEGQSWTDLMARTLPDIAAEIAKG
jgi:tetratricopeptide (TPR) repeat protein